MSILAALLAVTVVAHDPGYNTSLANHIHRWLTGEGVKSVVVPPSGMAKALAGERLAFLVGFGSPTAGELAQLRSFRARGGKLVVFHSAAPQLAAMMGVRPLGYAAAPYPGAWSAMCFDGAAPSGTPTRIRQTSSVLMKAEPLPGRGGVMATWHDRRGRATGDAAWIRTDAGWWMTHVLSADGDEALKAQLLAAICGAVDPKLWNAAKSAARRRAKTADMTAYAKQQVPRAGEIHAVWEHSGCGLYPGDWGRTMRLLKDSHVTDLFVNVAGFDFAHYPSGVLPRSRTFAQEGDQLGACLAAAKGTGIRVHAWVLCFTATRGDPARLAEYRRKGWCLKRSGGKSTEYLDPANAAVRWRLLAAIDELQTKYPALSGIHLDFVRYDDRCIRPRNAAEVVSRFVSEARRHVKRPRWLTAAVFGGYPNSISNVGQDWDSWLNANLVDYVCPMDYTASMAEFEGFMRQQGAERSHARRTIAGIGVTSNEARLDARQVMDQIRMSRKYGLAGNALFDLDVVLEGEVLPYLKLGMWK